METNRGVTGGRVVLETSRGVALETSRGVALETSRGVVGGQVALEAVAILLLEIDVAVSALRTGETKLQCCLLEAIAFISVFFS